MVCARKEEPSLSVGKEMDDRSVEERREEIRKRARVNLKRWQRLAEDKDSASTDVNQQQDKKRKLPENTKRPFTCQERGDYNRSLKQSGGFDVGYIPDNIDSREMPIKPYKVSDRPQNPDQVERLNKVENYSKMALDKYNEDNKTKFQFGKFIKANVGFCGGGGQRYYYVTFQSKYMPGSRSKNFQTRVFANRYGEGEVRDCRRVT